MAYIMTKLLAAVGVSIPLSSAEEIVEACKIVVRTESMSSGERDTLITAYQDGPVWDGDVPSKSSRDQLIEEGYLVRVVSKGQWGYCACTCRGATAYQALQSMAPND